MPRFRLVQLAVGFPDILFCILQSTGNSFLFRSLICRVMPLYAYLSKNSCKQSSQTFRETFFERFPLISFFRPSFFPRVPIQSPSIYRAPCNSSVKISIFLPKFAMFHSFTRASNYFHRCAIEIV